MRILISFNNSVMEVMLYFTTILIVNPSFHSHLMTVIMKMMDLLRRNSRKRKGISWQWSAWMQCFASHSTNSTLCSPYANTFTKILRLKEPFCTKQFLINKAYQAYWHLSLRFSGRDSISRGYISAILIHYKNFEIFLRGFRTNKTY